MSDNRYERGGRSTSRGGYRAGTPAPYRSRGPQQGSPGSHGRRMLPVWLLIVLDIVFLGAALNIYALIYTIPSTFEDTKVLTTISKGPAASASPSPVPTLSPTAGGTETESTPTGTATEAPQTTPTDQLVDQGDFGANFPDKFTDGAVEQTDDSYRSRDISVSITRAQENGATYFVADVYIRNLSNFKAILANDKLGKYQQEPQEDMAKRSNAILTINTDNYGDLTKGYAVRNGELARSTTSDDILALYADGTMKTFLKGKYSLDDITNAWQVYSFGPQLLQDGQPMDKFNSIVNPKNPRTAVGYYEPGHYCFVLVDGRQSGYSDGLAMTELSNLMYSLGCKVAYNMDGGQSSMMFFMGKLINKPYKGGRVVSDVAAIVEGN